MNDSGVSTANVIDISSGFLWSIFLLILVVVAIFSWILVHHWGYYGIKGNNKIFAKSLYFIGIGIFITISILLLGSYSFIK